MSHYFDKGIYELKSGNYLSAVKDFTRAIELNPKHAKAYFYRWMVRDKKRYRHEALEDLIKAGKLGFSKAYEIIKKIDERQPYRNPFLALAELASKKNWCWNIYCTTCGWLDFKLGFLKLVNGKHPDKSEWIIKREKYSNLHPFGLTTTQKERLLDIVAGVSVKELSKVAKFPDWLGYLGLVLFSCQIVEWRTRQMTKALIPQFLEIVDSRDAERLERRLLDKSTIMLSDLEFVERCLEEKMWRSYKNENYL
jgi:tetratricopeptide (TPR) repeat protein